MGDHDTVHSHRACANFCAETCCAKGQMPGKPLLEIGQGRLVGLFRSVDKVGELGAGFLVRVLVNPLHPALHELCGMRAHNCATTFASMSLIVDSAALPAAMTSS